MMRQIVPRIERMTNHFLQENDVTPEVENRRDISQEEYRMWKLKVSSMAQAVTIRSYNNTMRPIRWVEEQKVSMITSLRNVQDCVVTNPTKAIKSRMNAANESLNSRMWEMSWFVVLLMTERANQMKNRILDKIDFLVGAANQFKVKSKNESFYKISIQHQPTLKMMKYENQMSSPQKMLQ